MSPIIIGRYKNPKMLQKYQISFLHVQALCKGVDDQFFNTLAAMGWLALHKSRKVFLLSDRWSAHPYDFSEKLTSIKVTFLPANTTSKLQALDQGIIRSIMGYYRSLIVQFLFRLENVDKTKLANVDLLKSLNYNSAGMELSL